MFIPIPFLISIGLLIVILAALAASRPPARKDLLAPPPTAPTELRPDQLAEIRALVAAEQKIDAIKKVRELTGLGLKEAKDFVERL